MKKTLKAATLIEMIIVLGIILVLSGLLLVNGVRWFRQTKTEDLNANAKMLFNSVQSVVMDYDSQNRDKIYTTESKGKTFNCITTPVMDEFLMYYDGDNLTITHYYYPEAPDVSPDVIAQNVASTDGTNTTAVFQNNVLRDIERYYSDAKKYVWVVYVKDYLVREVIISEGKTETLLGAYPTTFNLDEISDFGKNMEELTDTVTRGSTPRDVLMKRSAKYTKDDFTAGKITTDIPLLIKIDDSSPTP